jgi:hypothetical protein
MRDDFAIFIMVHGRPEKMWTLHTLRHCGYSGKIYFVADDLDKTLEGYRAKYGDDLIVFDKNKAAQMCDSGDNSGDLRSTLYAANTIPELAKERDIKYFMIMCDDYFEFQFKFDYKLRYYARVIHERVMDSILDAMLEYFINAPQVLTLAMSQCGDFIGGGNNDKVKPTILRKAMNTFLCDVDRPFRFIGRLNEDVTTYIRLGGIGKLFLSFTDVAINQKESQQESKGLTAVYLDSGTYVKSFFSVMYNPSCVKVGMMGANHKRIHHHISWNNAVPCILSEQWRKPDEMTT